jgi:DNA polymerase I
VPVCMHAYERHTGTEIAMRREQLLACRRAPFDTGTDSVMMAYAANAELSCFLAGTWPLPRNVIDVYVETIAGINGNLDVWPEKRRPKLPEALELHGLTPAMSVEEKDRMRDVILGHTDYTKEQWQKIQVYNRVDTAETADLEEAFAPSLDLPRALFRGRYSGAAVARRKRPDCRSIQLIWTACSRTGTGSSGTTSPATMCLACTKTPRSGKGACAI